MKNIFILLTLCLSLITFGQKQLPLLLPAETSSSSLVKKTIDTDLLKAQLNVFYQTDKTADEKVALIEFPLADGSIGLFAVEESNVLSQEGKANYPAIKSFVGKSILHLGQSIRFNLFEGEVLGMIKSREDEVFIEPLKSDKTIHVFSKDVNTAFVCGVEESMANFPEYKSSSTTTNGTTLKTYTIAVAGTGEFTTENGGQMSTQNTIVGLVNILNGYYENEVGISLQLMSNNTNIVYTDSSTDPFNPSSNNLPVEAQNGISGAVPDADYDVGHVFHYLGSGGGSGIASIGVVCQNVAKAAGWSSYGSALGLPGLLDIALHEIAHQFGANHTFYGSASNCISPNRNPATAYEPGSGSTIMAYPGICGVHNIVEGSGDFYFHTHSLDEITNFITSPFIGASCAIATSSGNTPPTADAGSSYSIPVATPFELTGSGTDADGDNLTYCWEQYNTNATSSTANTAPADAADFAGAPLFRSFIPTTDPTRIFPKITDILFNQSTIGEVLSDVPQTATFRLTVRDNSALDGNSLAGGFAYDETTVQFVGNANTNPNDAFFITSPNSAVTWTAGSSATITWNIGNSNTAPVSCANVDILLSDDGGITFNNTIATGVPNNGSYTFTVPNFTGSSAARIKIKCSDNVFFDINDANFTYSNSCVANGATFSPDQTVTADVGDAALNLSLAPEYGTAFGASTTVTLDGSDGTTLLTYLNGSSCTTAQSVPYEAKHFFVDTDGVYSFSISSVVGVTIYAFSFDEGNPCTNWLGSNFFLNGANLAINNPVGFNLVSGTPYIITFTDLDGSTDTHTIAYSNSIGGTMYEGGVPSPGLGFSYTYFAVSSAGMITAVSASSDFTGITTDDTYTVYGLSYQTSALTPSTLVGTTLSSLQSTLAGGGTCGNLSSSTMTLNVTCPAGPGNCGGSTMPSQTIALVNNWNLVSMNCNPASTDMTVIWDAIDNNVIEVKNLTGSYVPLFGSISPDVETWDVSQGYKVKMSAADNLVVNCGSAIDPVTTPIALDEGWNIIAYWGQNPTNAAMAFSSIAGSIVQVKDLNGAYIPGMGNSLDGGTGNLIPGKGYQIKMTSATSFNYPAGLSPIIEGEKAQVPVYYTETLSQHFNNMILAFPIIPTSELSVGDEIAVYSEQGVLCGVTVYEGKPFNVMVYGKETGVAGDTRMTQGDIFEIRKWDINTQQEHILDLDFIEGDELFAKDKLSVVGFKTTNAIESLNTANVQFYPNPANDLLQVVSPELHKWNIIEIVQVDGKTMKSIRLNENTANALQVDISDLNEGVYFIKISGESTQFSGRFVKMD